MQSVIYVLLICLIFSSLSTSERQRRTLIFPPTSLYGTFVAVAVPLDIPDKNVFVSYNFETNIKPVRNITEIDEVLFPNLPIISSRHSRSITREFAYTVLETRFKEHGMNGKECMLRNICEAAETPLHHNGLIGHILHIIFTPSASKEEGLDNDYYEAELDGQHGNCDKYLEHCPFSLFDVITQLVKIIPSKITGIFDDGSSTDRFNVTNNSLENNIHSDNSFTANFNQASVNLPASKVSEVDYLKPVDEQPKL